MKILIVSALEQEIGECFPDVECLITGIGTENVVYAVTKYLYTKKRPDLILNLGTAGSTKFEIGSVINPSIFKMKKTRVSQSLEIQTYIDIQLGDNLDKSIFPIVNTTVNDFTTQKPSQESDCYDMEAFEISNICYKEDIKFMCFKYISDNMNEQSQKDWSDSISKAPEALRGQFDKIQKHL